MQLAVCGSDKLELCTDNVLSKGLFTYAFIHADTLHLTFNTYGILIYGGLVEVVQGMWRVAIVYILAAVLGSMGVVWQTYIRNDMREITYCIRGASGAFYGLLGSYVAQTFSCAESTPFRH